MKRIIILLTAVAVLFSGCWDLTESEKLGLVTVIGIDISENDQIKVVLEEISEQKQSSGAQKGNLAEKTPEKIHETVAPSISEAIENIASSDFHRTYFAHTSVIILSEELAGSRGIGTVIDYFQRNPEIRRNTWFLIAMKGQFDRIFDPDLSVETGTDRGKIIKEIIANKPRNSFLSANTLGDFLNLLWETGTQPYTSGIHVIETNTSNSGKSESSGDGSSHNYDFSIEDTALFKMDKLVGWMDDKESLGLLCVLGCVKGGSIFVNYNNKPVSLQIVCFKSYMKPVISNDGKMQMNIHINAVSDISESQANADYENEEVIKEIEKLQAAEIKKHINLALAKSRNLDIDVFGFGNYFFDKYPKYWNHIQANGYDYLRDIEVNLDVKSTVSQIGLVGKIKN